MKKVKKFTEFIKKFKKKKKKLSEEDEEWYAGPLQPRTTQLNAPCRINNAINTINNKDANKHKRIK